jgi:Kef-type K+ transport system membrane component KefB
MEHQTFFEVSVVIAIGAAISIIFKYFKQPLLIAYILTGIIVGPSLFNIVHSQETFSTFSEIGIALLLFIIGLDLSLRIFSRLGKVVLVTTTVQVLVVMLVGFAVSRSLQFGTFESLLIGLGLSMSSTIIIVKLFNDKKETGRLHAQIAIGILIVQDIIATGAKIGLATRASGGDSLDIILLLVRGIGLTVGLFLVSKYLIPKLNKSLESSKELLLLFGLGWGLGLATLFKEIGFSIEIGALFAGVSLATLPYSSEMASRLKPLRDFFLVIFFISLGQSLAPSKLLDVIWNALIFVLIVVIIKPLVVMISMGLLGYTKRTSLKSAISMSQVSEFSLVFLSAALAINAVSERALTSITLTALITFAISTYLIKYDNSIYSKIERHLRLFERRVTHSDAATGLHSHQFILIGYRKGGPEFIKTYQSMKQSFVVVDYDPDVIETLERHNHNYVYGDATDPELLEEINASAAKLVVSTISDAETNLFIAHWLNKHNQNAVFICNADSAHHASELYNEGASYVMMPHYIGSERIGAFIKKSGLKRSEFKKFRDKHLAYLANHYDDSPARHDRRRLGHAVLERMGRFSRTKQG